MSERSLRIAGIALALLAGAIHFVLFRADLIAGEATATPAFAAMAAGFLGCALLLGFASGDILVVVPIYAISLVFAYAVTRGQYPIELYGLSSKVAEVGLAIVAVALFRRPQAATSPGRGDPTSASRGLHER